MMHLQARLPFLELQIISFVKYYLEVRPSLMNLYHFNFQVRAEELIKDQTDKKSAENIARKIKELRGEMYKPKSDDEETDSGQTTAAAPPSTKPGLATNFIFLILTFLCTKQCQKLLPGGQITPNGKILISSVPPSNSLVLVSEP